MANLSLEDLKKSAKQIRDETEKNANTAKRIGEMFLNIIETFEELLEPSQGEEYLTVDKDKVTFENQGGNEEVSVNSNINWNIE